jgi:hypothetical protein
MANMKSRVNAHIDRSLGYLGLFLIGLIGWVYDRLARPATRGQATSQPRVPRNARTF